MFPLRYHSLAPEITYCSLNVKSSLCLRRPNSLSEDSHIFVCIVPCLFIRSPIPFPHCPIPFYTQSSPFVYRFSSLFLHSPIPVSTLSHPFAYAILSLFLCSPNPVYTVPSLCRHCSIPLPAQSYTFFYAVPKFSTQSHCIQSHPFVHVVPSLCLRSPVPFSMHPKPLSTETHPCVNYVPSLCLGSPILLSTESKPFMYTVTSLYLHCSISAYAVLSPFLRGPNPFSTQSHTLSYTVPTLGRPIPVKGLM